MFTIRRRGWHMMSSLTLVLALLVSSMGQPISRVAQAAGPSERDERLSPYLPLADAENEHTFLAEESVAVRTSSLAPSITAVPATILAPLPAITATLTPTSTAGPLPYREWLELRYAFLNRTSTGKALVGTGPLEQTSNQEGFPEWSHPNTQVSSVTGMLPAVAADGQGNLHAVWVYDIGYWTIYYAKWDAQTGTWGAASRVNENRSCGWPDVAVDGQGTVHVVWEGLLSLHSDRHIYHNELFAGSHQWTPNVQVDSNPDPSSYCRFPKIVVDENDNLHVTWTDWRNDDNSIRAAKRPTGGGSWTESVVTDMDYCGWPNLAVNETGDVYAVYDHDPGGQGSQGDIYCAVLPAGQSQWQGHTLVSGGRYEVLASIAVTGQDMLHVVWTRDADPYDESGGAIYYAQRPAGGGWSSPVLISDPEASGSEPHIAADTAGNLCVVWPDWWINGYANIYSVGRWADGNTWTDEVMVNDYHVNRHHVHPALTVDADGQFHAVWTFYAGSTKYIYSSTSAPAPPPPSSSRLARENCHLDHGPQDQGYYPPGGSVNTFTGNLSHQEVDISIPTLGEPLFLERSYNSLDDYAGPLGPGWTHNYHMRLDAAGDDVTLIAPRGSRLRFTNAGGGAYTGDPGVRATLVQSPGGVYTLTYTNQTQYCFDSAGQFTTIVPANGQATTLSYTGELLTTVTGPAGRSLTFTYDDQDRIIQVTDPLGRVTGYGYTQCPVDTAAGRLATVTDPLGQITHYAYDDTDRLLSITNPAGEGELSVTYNDQGRVTTQADGLNQVTTFDYQAGYTVVTDPRGQPLQYNYDASGVLTSRQDAAGGTLAYTPDGNYNSTATTDELGRTTTYEYGDCGCTLTAITEPLGGVTRMTYDGHNNLLSRTDPLGHTWHYEYDARDNLVLTTDPLGGQVSYAYDELGQLTSRTDERGHTTTYEYDQWGNRTTIIDAQGNITRMEYDAAGRLTTVTDPLEATTIFSYDALDRLTAITDAEGGTVSYEYDAAGNRTAVTDANDHTTHYEYDAAHQLADVADAEGGTVSYGYDAAGNRTAVTDANDHTTHYDYDDLNRLETVTDAETGVTEYEYDAVGNRTAVTDANGHTTYYDYDDLNRLETVTDARNGVAEYEYDAAGNLIGVTDANGHTTHYEYDALGRLTTVIDALNGQTTYEYDPAGNRIAATDAAGHLTTLDYDAVNRLTTVTDALHGQTTYEYYPAGNLRQVSDPLSRVTQYGYDDLNRLTQVIDPLGHTTAYGYDAVGNRTHITDPTGRPLHLGYDELNRLTTITDNLGHATAYEYDAVGNRVQITDPAFHITGYEYDALNRLVLVTDALNGATVYEYDAVGNLLAVTDPNGHTTTYTYDDLDRLERAADPLGHATVYEYDAVGNPIARTDANGTITAYEYDDLDRLTTIQYPSANVQLAYNAVGWRTRMDDATGRTTYVYDALGRLTDVTDGAGETVRYQYDAAGQRVRLAYPTPLKTVEYTYDAAGRLERVQDWLQRTTRYTYDAAGRILEVRLPNDTSARYSYDGAGRLVEVLNQGSVGTLSRFRYTLDAVGNRLEEESPWGWAEYHYDPLGRLTSEAYKRLPGLEPIPVTYTYDAAGNRLTQAGALGAKTYTYDAANRLTAVNGTPYTWDDAGNLLSDGVRAYTWDTANRLTRVVSGTQAIQYTYNGDGVRVQQTVNGAITRYVQDLAAPLPVVLAERSKLQTSYYLYGLDLIGQEAAAWQYYHYDGLGSVRNLTDLRGREVARYSYYAFGQTRATSGAAAGGNQWRFTGEQWDAGAGLYYLRARYYEPTVGRFTSRDPFAGWAMYPQSLNGFSYAGNQPTNWTDPSGLWPPIYETVVTGPDREWLLSRSHRYNVEYYQGLDPQIYRPEWRPKSGLDYDLSDYANDPLMLLYARMIWAENRSYEDPDYWLAAAIVSAWVAKNRLADTAFYNQCCDYPSGLRCVLLKESQFHGLWQVAARDPLGAGPDASRWSVSVEIAVRVWHGDIPEPESTHGATRFYKPEGTEEIWWRREEEKAVSLDPKEILDDLRRRGIRLPVVPL